MKARASAQGCIHAILIAALALSGCSASTITSSPPGATIYVNGKPTNKVTPAKLTPKDVKPGQHQIEVRLDGYQPSKKLGVANKVGTGRVVTSILFPIPFLIINLARGFRSVEPDNRHFVLKPISEGGSTSKSGPQSPPADGPGVSVTAPAPLDIPEGAFGRLAVLPTQLDESSKNEVPELFDDYVLSAVQNLLRTSVIGQSDIAALLNFEAQKDLLNCDDASCMADIGGALGVDRILVVKVARLREDWVVTAKLLNIKRTQVEARANHIVEGSLRALLRDVPLLVNEIFANALAK